jgi:hypothetical protein
VSASVRDIKVQGRLRSVQLLELDPDELGVASHGIYVVDDDEVRVIAGPFDTEALALEWIDDDLSVDGGRLGRGCHGQHQRS